MNRYLLLTAILLLTAFPVAAADVGIVVDISERELSVYRDGSLVNTYTVAVGLPDHPTPTGDFTIETLIWNPAWVPPDSEWAEDEERQGPGDPDNPMKTAKIFFKRPDYYIHGTGDEESLGEAASHGCIRMDQWAVAEVAKLLMESSGESREQSWYNETIEQDIRREVHLDEAVPIKIDE